MRSGPDDYVQITVQGRIAIAELARPERGNAYSARDHSELCALVDRFASDDSVDVIVIHGRGDAFCIGPDREFAAALAQPDVGERAINDARAMVSAAIRCDKPVVVAVNGKIVGGAVAFALLGDIVIIERNVRLRDVHVPAALAAGDGGLLVWPLAMGMLRAKRYLLTGDAVSAEEAHAMGLVTEVVEPGQSIRRALEYAQRFAKGSQPAIRGTKRALHELYRGTPWDAFNRSNAEELATMGSEESIAAMAALMEGRA
jgi:enoyl-CoA hydratase